MLRRLYRLMNYRKPRELSRKFCTRIGEICDSKFEWVCYLISLQTQYEIRDETKYLVCLIFDIFTIGFCFISFR